MSISGASGVLRTHTNINYDHAILLVDATKPKRETLETSEENDAATSRSPSGASLSRKWTKSTLREDLARRKYAKWQADTPNEGDDVAKLVEGCEDDVLGEAREGKAQALKGSPTRTGRLRDKIPFRSKKQATTEKKGDTYIDILYENQRGWFFCGIPLYSSRSLLPVDPSSWQTGDFRDSPVNITNAQVPDPSWGWSWQRWYVDMSYDVDEEGWQYSFNFHGYAWHGNHPWFHSFTRRRRWLRKRIKLIPMKGRQGAGKMGQAHLLNEDYFTIHAFHDRSRESSADRSTNKRSSFLSNPKSDSDSDMENGDITDILKLMAILKRARVDREKISAVKKFIDQGGEDLFYLADKMEEIMQTFIYETSGRQLCSDLQQVLHDTEEQKKKPVEDAEAEDETKNQNVVNLTKAAHAAVAYLDGQGGIISAKDPDEKFETSVSLAENADNKEKGNTNTPEAEDFEGIPEDADISEEPGIRWEDEDAKPAKLDKGKKKAQ